jgi:hypothetical protein
MKRQPQIFAIALLLAVVLRANGGVPTEDRREHFRALRAQTVKQTSLSPLDRAYLDGLMILGHANGCREFFGEEAQNVLTELVAGLRETKLDDACVGVRMSGRFTVFSNPQSHLLYRLFTDAALNTAGPFFKAKVFAAEPFVPAVGSFQPNTRAARALILFHELAHLIQRDGAWLIPDDGDQPGLSRSSNRTIEARCGEQIRAL